MNNKNEAAFSELKKALLEMEKPSEYFEMLRRENALDEYYPELKALINVPQNIKYHREGDVWTHTMLVTDEAAKRRGIVKYPAGFMLSALCHDLGKAVCTTVTDGIVHSYRHETEGVPLVRKFLGRFPADEELTAYVADMTALHMAPNILANADSKIKRTNKLFDESAEPFDLIQLSICDGLGKIPQCTGNEKFLLERYEIFREIMARPFVTEKDLLDAGIGQENMQELLEYSHKLRLAGCGRENSLRQCIAYYKKILKKGE